MLPVTLIRCAGFDREVNQLHFRVCSDLGRFKTTTVA